MLATFKFTRASLRIFGIELSRHPFSTGGRQLLFPGMLREEVFAWLALLAFGLCAAALLIKCSYEVTQRRLNIPKTLHMTLAAGLFFITPALQNLDVAFQGLNTWHSFQYLAVVFILNRYRQAHGLIGSATVARFASRGWGMYAVGIGLTAACGVLYLALRGLVLLIDAWPGDGDAAALLLLLRPVLPPHPLLLRPLPLPPHRQDHHPVARSLAPPYRHFITSRAPSWGCRVRKTESALNHLPEARDAASCLRVAFCLERVSDPYEGRYGC